MMTCRVNGIRIWEGEGACVCLRPCDNPHGATDGIPNLNTKHSKRKANRACQREFAEKFCSG